MSDGMERVVLIMPVYNEARHLPATLQSIASQTFDHERMYFVAVDANSSDASADVLRAWFAQSGITGCVIGNPRRKIPIALNLGLKQATDNDIIVRLDAHTLYGETYVADAVRALATLPLNVGCIGPGHRPLPAETFEQRVVEALYTNPWGLGGADFRFGDGVRDVDQVYLGVWRPGVLTRSDGFNETMEANEDGEMSARLRKMGYRIVRVPLPCRVVIKRGMLGSIRQWNRYGYWRAKMLRRNPEFVRVRHVVSPVAALIAVALVCSPLRFFLLPAAVGYALLVFRGRAKGEPLGITLTSVVYFPVLQFAFAAGMLAGLLTPRGIDWPPESSRSIPAEMSS